MTLTVLIENTTCRDDLACEHGLSLYLEVNGRRILFDAGQTDAFADNAARLGVDLRSVDTAILSHGHYDHGGGMPRFLALNDSAPLYLRADAFGGYHNAAEKYIGLDPALRESSRLRLCTDETDLGDGLTLYTCNALPRPYDTDTAGLTVRDGDRLTPDPFTHEHYLLIREGNRNILISGCSHKGIRNLTAWFAPDILVGGFHFKALDPDTESGRAALDEAAAYLSATQTQFYTCHCTGEPQFAYLQAQLGDQVRYISTGCTLSI